MMANRPTGRVRWHRQHLAALTYVALVVLAGMTVVWAALNILERYSDYRESAEALAQFEGRAQMAAGAKSTPWPPGSPLLEGQTATVASAALMQQVSAAITRVGGSVVSTEVEAQAAQPKDDYLRVTATCDLEQAALPRLLHDIEAGMPFLFVDQLLVQNSTAVNESTRLRVRLVVSGLWPRAR